ncbi:MAG: sialidase family protein [Humidesulfovibrio sp.]|nr:sialidase family protein [Humidesulfovibrio sp.]
MPSLDSFADRHVVIDRRPGHYLCFPDVCLADDGTILCVYNEFDRHVGTRRRLLLRTSSDHGRTWSGRRMLRADDSHCPRLSALRDGTLCLIDDAGPVILWSTDNGEHWVQHPGAGLLHGLMDRALELDSQTLFTAGHQHRGSHPRVKIRQAPSEQMAYISRNLGRSWEALSVIANEKCLVLCEASVIRLPGLCATEPVRSVGPVDAPEQSGPRVTASAGVPRLLALMRENSFAGEPMYYSISEDGGINWSAPLPTPLIGHRPTLGWTRSGKLLVTYRDIGADPGTKAWLGDLDELCSDFAVHGLHHGAHSPVLTPDGLLVNSADGPDDLVRYFLRPLTDPEFARAEFQADVLVRHADENGCGIRLGIWWKLFPDGILPDVTDAEGGAGLVAWEPDRFHTVRIVYEPGLCRLFIDGEARGAYPVDPLDGDSRPILVGSVSRKTDNACEVVWRRMALSTSEPRLGREYAWRWDHTEGFPDAYVDTRVLELKNDRLASPADFGYSGWVETADGEFFCAYHHGGGAEPDYVPGESSYVLGTWFNEEDFGVLA